MVATLLSVAVMGQLTVIPNNKTDGAAVVISEVVGTWMIFTPQLNPIKPKHVFEGGKVAVVSGPPGDYVVVQFTQSETGIDWSSAKVTIIGDDPGPDPKPDPDPDPDPKPPPGKRKVVIIYESEENTTPFKLATQSVQQYCLSKSHEYYCIDDDAVNPDGNRPAWLAEYIGILNSAKVPLPGLLVIANWQGKPYASPMPFPATGEEAIKKIQEAGG